MRALRPEISGRDCEPRFDFTLNVQIPRLNIRGVKVYVCRTRRDGGARNRNGRGIRELDRGYGWRQGYRSGERRIRCVPDDQIGDWEHIESAVRHCGSLA